jgi:hypothetical protein
MSVTEVDAMRAVVYVIAAFLLSLGLAILDVGSVQKARARTQSLTWTSRPGTTGNYLLGCDCVGYDVFKRYVGANPAMQGCGNWDCPTYPQHFGMYQYYNQANAQAAANNQLTSQWQTDLTRADPSFPNTYFIRACSEWQGQVCSPWINKDENQGEAVSPATWIAGIRNFINFVRADPHFANAKVKIGFDVPYTAEQAKYYPGDAYVDIITYDIYAGKGQGGTSDQAWQNMVNYGPLAWMLKYNKPMAFPEYCDKFPDGGFTAQFAQWASTHNVVAVVPVHDPSYGASPPFGEVACSIDTTQGKLNAFINAWAGYKYTGSYWPKIIPWPS